MIISINVLNVKGTKFSLRGDMIDGAVYQQSLILAPLHFSLIYIPRQLISSCMTQMMSEAKDIYFDTDMAKPSVIKRLGAAHSQFYAAARYMINLYTDGGYPNNSSRSSISLLSKHLSEFLLQKNINK